MYDCVMYSVFYSSLCCDYQVMERGAWRAALESGNYELLVSEGKENWVLNGEVEAMEIEENHIRVKDR